MKYWLLALLLALPIAAQNQNEEGKKQAEPPPPPIEYKLFILKYADPRQVATLLSPLGASVQANPELRAVAVSARARDMPGIEDAIKRLDVPAPARPDIDLTAYLVVGSDAAPGSGAVPKELESVMAQLKNAFPFKFYHLMDMLSLRTRSGDGGSTKSVSQPEGSQAPVYDELNIGTVTVNPDGLSMRVDRLRALIRLNVGIPSNVQYTDLGLNADVDIKPGQKVVVGRLGMGRDQALFLVLTASVVP